jgi:uncharacterized protein (TIGR03790 family)
MTLAVITAALMVAVVSVRGDERLPAGITAADSPAASVTPLENVRVGAGDGYVTLAWSISRQFAGDFRGVRLYRARDGREIRYNQPPEVLLEDIGLRTSWTVPRLENGEQYTFILKAYDSEKREFWSAALLAYPGSDSRGAPRTPASIYSVAGDGRIGLFWDRNREADLALYEVQRKGPQEQQFRTVARLPKVLRLSQERKQGGPDRNELLVLSPAAYQDRTVTNGVSYQYRLRAVDMERKASPFSEPVTVHPRPYTPPSGKDILLIVNSSADDSNHDGVNDSEEVARYYAEKRQVPAAQIIRLPLKRDIYAIDYARDIGIPLREFLLSGNLAGKVTMLVPCFGMPTWSGGLALDSRLSDLFDRYIVGRKMGTPNPYFDTNRHFDGTDGVYLVTRLDGPTVEIAKALVDKALFAGQRVSASSGKVGLGGRGTKELGDVSIRKTAEFGRWLGLDVTLKDPGTYAEHELGPDVFWYFAWYHGYIDPVQGRWPTGAVAAHLTSYSFSGIREPDPAKKSWVQGLLEKGITATFGSVVEPYQQGFTRAEIFFSHFWPGDYTFAESFFMATPTVQWAMSAVGDPLFRLKKMPVKGSADSRPASAGEPLTGSPR